MAPLFHLLATILGYFVLATLAGTVLAAVSSVWRSARAESIRKRRLRELDAWLERVADAITRPTLEQASARAALDFVRAWIALPDPAGAAAEDLEAELEGLALEANQRAGLPPGLASRRAADAAAEVLARAALVDIQQLPELDRLRILDEIAAAIRTEISEPAPPLKLAQEIVPHAPDTPTPPTEPRGAQ